MSYYLSDCIIYAHEPVQNHIQEHAGLDDITRPRKWLQQVSQWAMWSVAVHLLYLVARVVEVKTVSCLLIFVSNIMCAATGNIEVPCGFVDIIFYKSLAVLIGFLLSFRATRANERRTSAYVLVETLCDAARDLFYLFPALSDIREEAKQILRYTYFNLARYFSHQLGGDSLSERATVAFNLASIAPKRRETLLLVSSIPELHISPKQMISALPPVFTEMYKEFQLKERCASTGNKDATLSENEKVLFMQLCRTKCEKIVVTYESICLMESTRTTSLYRTMLEVTLFLFLASFAWVATFKTVAHMLTSSLLVTFVYFGVDVVADEVDDPFGNDITDIPLNNMVREMFELLDYEDYIQKSIKGRNLGQRVNAGVRSDPTRRGSRNAWREAMHEVCEAHHNELIVLRQGSIIDDQPEPHLVPSLDTCCSAGCSEPPSPTRPYQRISRSALRTSMNEMMIDQQGSEAERILYNSEEEEPLGRNGIAKSLKL